MKVERPRDGLNARPLSFESLPREIQFRIFLLLSPVDIATVSCVCTKWRELSPFAWECQLQLLSLVVDPAIMKILSNRSETASEVCRQMLIRHFCLRCGALFQDKGNGSSSCRFHPGPMLGGGLQNGIALRWVCCNRRVHPSSPQMDAMSRDRFRNGCMWSYHVSQSSAWEATGNMDVTPRLSVMQEGPKSRIPRSRTGRNCCSPLSIARHPMEWDPHHRYGLLELPSRLLSMLGSGA